MKLKRNLLVEIELGVLGNDENEDMATKKTLTKMNLNMELKTKK